MSITIPKPARSSAEGGVAGGEAAGTPTKKLPTERIKFKSQLDIIRAYAVLSNNGGQAVNYKDVAKSVRLDASTVSLMSAFLVENGFIERVGNDAMPSKSVIDFALAHTWAPDNASQKLAPLIRKTWFGTKLLMLLAFRSVTEEEAVRELAHEVSAGPKFKDRISVLVDYAVEVGLVRREGNQLYLGGEALGGSQPETPQSTGGDDRQPAPEQRAGASGRAAGAAVATGFMTTEGVVQFHVSIRVTMAEMAGWTPDRITAFFSGLAKVLAAKKGTEEVG